MTLFLYEGAAAHAPRAHSSPGNPPRFPGEGANLDTEPGGGHSVYSPGRRGDPGPARGNGRGEGRLPEAPPRPARTIIADDSGRSSARRRAAANFSGRDQKFLAGQLPPPSARSFPLGSAEAVSRHPRPPRATSPPPLIHKGARRRPPGHVGGAHGSSSARRPRALRPAPRRPPLRADPDPDSA